jgi:hypothetical protein
MSKDTGLLINRLIQLNIWCYHPRSANPTNADLYKLENEIKEIAQELSQRLNQTGATDE